MPLSHVSAPSSKRRRRGYPRAADSDDEGEGVKQSDEEDFIAAQDAIGLVRDPRADTLAPGPVEEAVWKKISG